MRNIEWKTRDNIFLRGWLFTPLKIPAPIIVMTPGFSALKEHGLTPFAEYFQRLGFCVLLYDNRNFGESDGSPRYEVDPLLQSQDLMDAMQFLQTLKEVDSQKIFLWGTSFSAGNVVNVAAENAPLKAICLQVPFLMGHHAFLQEKNPEMLSALQKKYLLDAKARAKGMAPMMTSVVTNNPKKSAIMKEKEAYDYFTRVRNWENRVTLRSIENSGNYFPIHVVQKIQAPTLYIVANRDTICPGEIAYQAFEKTITKKKLVKIDGDHFSPYDTQFDVCVRAAGEWFIENRE